MNSVAFVSLGPGEPELITLKGLKILQSADCIFYPATRIKGDNIVSRALDILIELGIEKEKLTPFFVPMRKDRTLAIEAYNQVSEVIKEQYNKNVNIAVVAEGDSGFYSSVHYIADNLEENQIPVNQIAGIPAFIASGALAGIHVVKQEEELNVIPGIISASELKTRIEARKVIVIMKVSLCQEAVKECITELPDAQYHYFENVGVEGREYYTQDKTEISTRNIPYFSLMIIRK